MRLMEDDELVKCHDFCLTPDVHHRLVMACRIMGYLEDRARAQLLDGAFSR